MNFLAGIVRTRSWTAPDRPRHAAGQLQPSPASAKLFRRSLASAACTSCRFTAPANFGGTANREAQHNGAAPQYRDASKADEGQLEAAQQALLLDGISRRAAVSTACAQLADTQSQQQSS